MHFATGHWKRIGQLAVAAAAAWTAQSLLSLAIPNPTSALDYTMVLPMVLTMVALW